VFALGLVTLAGCSRKPCDGKATGGQATGKLTDVVSAKATVCKADNTFASVEFPGDDNPFVTVTTDLEGKGFTRTSQSIQDPKMQNATFKKGNLQVKVRFMRENGGYWTVGYEVSGS
jgi:hypothetical protein